MRRTMNVADVRSGWAKALLLVTLTMGVVLGANAPAFGGVRVSVRWGTPSVRVARPAPQRHVVRRARVPVWERRAPRVMITARDHRIARRMANLSGFSKGYLISLRSSGRSWRRIGKHLDIPRRVVRASLSHESYVAFLHHRDRETCRVVVGR